MNSLIIPEILNIKLTSESKSLELGNVFVYIKTKARHKNDYRLGPFKSDDEGPIILTKQDLLDKIDSELRYAPMDYAEKQYYEPTVKISLYDPEELLRLIKHTSTIWPLMAKNLKKKWKSKENFIEHLEKATNKKLAINKATKNIKVNLDGSQNGIFVNFPIYKL